MKIVNVIIVYNQDETELLMCHRQKDPYKGLFNFVGGKKEANETDMEAAYRELFEETGISDNQIHLNHLMSTQYHEDSIELQVFYGTLNQAVELKEEAHPLLWMCLDNDFTNNSKFAGNGNISHMLAMIKYGQTKTEDTDQD